MSASIESFYDDLAQHYHLIFEDWNRSIARQASILGPIIERATGKRSLRILDCACGIGTQTLGLAQRGHALVGLDLSRSAIERARIEARQRSLDIPFYVADMREISGIPDGKFDVVLAADNALPHLLTQPDLERALAEMATRLTDSGVLLVTLRDYDSLISTRPTVQPPVFYPQEGGEGRERIVHQVWRWHGDEYEAHLYITIPADAGWSVHHFHWTYRALLREDLNRALQAAGFVSIEWLFPDTTSFYQPIVVARKSLSTHPGSLPLAQPLP